jgi:hypothetical protein
MIGSKEYQQARERAVGFFAAAGIVLTEKEKQAIEVADFGLGDLARVGLEVLVYVNTSRVCAKELVMFPGQTCPEHRHPTRGGAPGKRGDLPLPLGKGVPVRSWLARDPGPGRSGALPAIPDRGSPGRAESRGPVHPDTGHLALVLGRCRGSGGFRGRTCSPTRALAASPRSASKDELDRGELHG